MGEGRGSGLTRLRAPDPAVDLAFQLRALRLEFIPEFCFHPHRKWRFDFAFPERKFAVEVEGGTWVNGRHSRGQGFENDTEKYAEALCLGWLVLRVTSGQVANGKALTWIEKALKVRP